MWTDEYKQRAYSAVTAHWIDDWRINSRVIATQEFPAGQQKTGVNVRQHLQDIFTEFNISSQQLHKAAFTTDKGSNIIAALQDEDRIDCANHVLNRVLQQSLEEKHAPAAVSDTISSVKDLVRFIKKTSLQDQLSTSLKQSQATRWNSTYTMLNSLVKVYDELRTLLALHRPDDLHRLTCISKKLLQELVTFLQPFHTTTKDLEGESDPTLQLVIPKMKKLESHVQVSSLLSYLCNSTDNIKSS